MKRILAIFLSVIMLLLAAPVAVLAAEQPAGTDKLYPEEFYWDKAGEDADNGYKAFSVPFGEPLKIPEDPVREGSKFLGWKDWYTDEFVDLKNETMDSTDGRKFYAAWKKSAFTITYYDGNEILRVDTYAAGDPITLPTPPDHEGYSFKNWRWSMGVLTVIIEQPRRMPEADLIALANYEPNTYVSSFYVDGKLFTEINNVYGQSFIVPRSPEKEGYTFAGWSPKLPQVTPIGDQRFDATFLPNTYTATLLVDGEVYKEIPYTYGQKSIDLPDVPKKAGYTGAWEGYSLVIGGVTINAVYTAAQVQSVEANDITLYYKQSGKIQPRIKADDGASYTVRYVSSNPDIATVDRSGKVYGAKRGTTQIKITVTDVSGKTVTDYCTVEVKNNFLQWLIVIFLFGWIWY